MVEVAPNRNRIRISIWKYVLVLLFLLLLAALALWGLLDSQWGATNPSAEWFRKYLSKINKFRPDVKPEDNLANALRIHGVERLEKQRYAMLFSVTDANGEPIANLQKSAVTIAVADPGSTPKAVVIDQLTPLSAMKTWNDRLTFAAVMDYSGSMFPSDLDAIEANYVLFMQGLTFPFAATVFKFNSLVEEILTISTSFNDIDTAIKKRITLGSTALFKAMDKAVGALQARQHLRFMLLTTDGNNNVPGVSLDDVIKNCRQHFLSCFVLGFGWLNVDILKQIANETDGYYVYVPDSAELKTWFPKMAKIAASVQVAEFNSSVDIQPMSSLELTVNTGGNTLKRSR